MSRMYYNTYFILNCHQQISLYSVNTQKNCSLAYQNIVNELFRWLHCHVLSNFIDLSNAYWLYGRYTQHISFQTIISNWMFYSSSVSYSGYRLIAQWSKSQVSNLMVVRSSQLRPRFFLHTLKNCKHVY